MIGTRLAARRRLRRVASVPLEEARPVLEGLLEGILAFWDERVLDLRDGGYRLDHDWRGRPTGERAKHVVTQARVAWFFARLSRSPFGGERHLEWSAHGVRFLRERMWDADRGGFAWRVDPAGPGDPRKHVYGQAFAIFALSEFARAAGDSGAAAVASETAELVHERAYDERHGGYLESRASDWSPEPAGSPGVLGRPAELKTVNTHLHLVEALTELLASDPRDAVRRRLRELIDLTTGPLFDREHGTCWDCCEPDWTPVKGYPSSYGHDLEAVWLVARGAHAAGVPEEPLAPIFASLWSNALARGFDDRRGGLFASGPPGQPADRREKVWWVQAEALLSALHMWHATADERYRHAFERTLGWIDGAQADREAGDWHAEVAPSGVPSGDKSGKWKDPYHQGRAVLECLELLAGS
jgi:mannose/cellobiose epimerase-like protein (N-acyl-D-glucosamine 2-epimerase family)